jgi:hypothetical protein
VHVNVFRQLDEEGECFWNWNSFVTRFSGAGGVYCMVRCCRHGMPYHIIYFIVLTQILITSHIIYYCILFNVSYSMFFNQNVISHYFILIQIISYHILS